MVLGPRQIISRPASDQGYTTVDAKARSASVGPPSPNIITNSHALVPDQKPRGSLCPFFSFTRPSTRSRPRTRPQLTQQNPNCHQTICRHAPSSTDKGITSSLVQCFCGQGCCNPGPVNDSEWTLFFFRWFHGCFSCMAQMPTWPVDCPVLPTHGTIRSSLRLSSR